MNIPNLSKFEYGGGEVQQLPDSSWLLKIPPTSQRAYADAQLQDYARLARRNFPWRVADGQNVRLRFLACTSHLPHEMAGTFGFGLWNNPISPSGGSLFALPQVVWWFGASAPNELQFTTASPGNGWGAGTLAGARLPGWCMLPGAALALPLTRIPALRRVIIRLAQRLLFASDAPLAVGIDPREWHEYCLEWGAGMARFWLDGSLFYETTIAPNKPLGFVAWVDNQYAVLSPNSAMRFGLQECAFPRWIKLRWLDK